MANKSNRYTHHLLSSVTNDSDQKLLLKAAELQGRGCLYDAALQYESLQESRDIPGVVIYETRLLLMKGDFRKASLRLKSIIGPDTKAFTTPVDALILLLNLYCNVFLHIQLQEAVVMARQVRELWLEPEVGEREVFTDAHVLLEYYYQSVITMKQMLQERVFVEKESAAVLRQRRDRLYDRLVTEGRIYEALDVSRMEMKFGRSDLAQLERLEVYLKLLDKYASNTDLEDSNTFPLSLYEQCKPICAGHIHISIGKSLGKLDRVQEGGESFITAITLFEGLDSLNGTALAKLQIALNEKTTMLNPMKTCQDLRSISNDLISCKDWIGTNSALSELSEMFQCGPPSFQPQFQACQKEIQEIYERTGNSFQFWNMQSQVWMFEFTKPTSFGKGIEMCEAFFIENQQTCSIRLVKDAFATMLVTAYQAIGDEDRAMKYAEMSLSLMKEVGDRKLIIAEEVAVTGIWRKMNKNTAPVSDIEDRIQLLEELFREGSSREGEQLSEARTLVALAVYLADFYVIKWDRSNIDDVQRDSYLSRAESCIVVGQEYLPQVDEDNKSSSRASIEFVHAGILQRMDRTAETVELCEGILSSQDEIIPKRDRANIQHLLATTLMLQSSKDSTTQTFQGAKLAYIDASKTAKELGDNLMAAGCLKALVQMCSFSRQSSVPMTVATTEILGWVQQWEDIWDEILSEASTYRGLQGLEVRQRIRQNNSTDLYTIAVSLCRDENNYLDAWTWTQKAKARAVSTSLGLSRLIPPNLSQTLSDDALTLLEKENTLLNDIETAEPGWRYHLRMEHLELRREMSSIPKLRAIHAVRQGGSLEIDDLVNMFEGKQDVLCVDWVELEDGRYHLLTVRPGEPPRYYPTGVTVAEVQEWLECYIYAEDSVAKLEDAIPEDLESLEELVTPLSDLAAEGELLVFVPTGLLCSIPLHALNLNRNGDTRPVIEWNPIIYSNSLAIFRQIISRADNTTSTHSGTGFKMAVFGNPTPTYKTRIDTEIQVGQSLKADIFLEDKATSDSLLNALQTHNLVHYHGHAEFHSNDILQTSVLKMNNEDLTLERIFQVPILQSPHISLIACQSGQQKLTLGDEPLGFLTALTIAGAGSVLGTLWELDDLYASSVFTEYFYEDLKGNIETEKTAFVFDLAVACQKAVCKMREREETQGLYYWAPLILYGSPSLSFKSEPGQV